MDFASALTTRVWNAGTYVLNYVILEDQFLQLQARTKTKTLVHWMPRQRELSITIKLTGTSQKSTQEWNKKKKQSAMLIVFAICLNYKSMCYYLYLWKWDVYARQRKSRNRSVFEANSFTFDDVGTFRFVVNCELRLSMRKTWIANYRVRHRVRRLTWRAVF